MVIPMDRIQKDGILTPPVTSRGSSDAAGEAGASSTIPRGEGSVRTVNLNIEREGERLGFNVRGGSEFGLGIYVSMYVEIDVCAKSR